MKKLLFLIFIYSLSLPSLAQCWTQVAAGTYHTVAIKSDGTLWAWGLNDKGQLGDGTSVNKNVPTQIGIGDDWSIVTAYGYNTLAIKTDGTLWSWGNNSVGQVGDGNHGNGVIMNIPIQLGIDNDWVKVAPSRAFAIKSNGTLWGWGDNADGRLGTGDMTPHYTPFQIGIENDWTDVDAGGNQTLALKTNHTLWGWGLNKSGSLAIGAVNNFVLVPTQTGNNTADWEKISVGGCCSSKMIKSDGSLWGIGAGSYGNLGNGETTDTNTPINIGNQTDWDRISTSNHTCGIKNNNTLWVWGNNAQGQLGDGTTINKSIPLQIGQDINWASVKTGLTHTVALSTSGDLYSWGWNNYGQLGDGTVINRNVITSIGSLCTLNISNYNIQEDVKIFPNPSSGILNVRFKTGERGNNVIIISDILGQKIFEQKFFALPETNETQIDLSTYNAGLYLLTLKTATGSVTVKVIKQSP